MMLKSRNTSEANWLRNSHIGELIRSEFIKSLDFNLTALTESIGVSPTRLKAMLDGDARLDGELDLRLTRYFRMSEGFFLGLQDDYELLEAKRALNGDLDRIVPRAA